MKKAAGPAAFSISVRAWRPLFHCEFNRAVVRTEYVGVDLCALYASFQILGYDKIVDTPACILLTGLETV